MKVLKTLIYTFAAMLPGVAFASSATSVVHVSGNTPTALTTIAPENGFQVSIGQNFNPFNQCWVEDDTADVGNPDAAVGIPIGIGYSGSNSQIGLSAIYSTPPGYTPMGRVYIVCNQDAYIEIKTW